MLLGHENHAKSTFADLLQELIRPDPHAHPFADTSRRGRRQPLCLVPQNFLGPLMRPQEPLDAIAKLGVARAGLIEKCSPGFCRTLFKGLKEDGIFVHGSERAEQERSEPLPINAPFALNQPHAIRELASLWLIRQRPATVPEPAKPGPKSSSGRPLRAKCRAQPRLRRRPGRRSSAA